MIFRCSSLDHPFLSSLSSPTIPDHSFAIPVSSLHHPLPVALHIPLASLYHQCIIPVSSLFIPVHPFIISSLYHPFAVPLSPLFPCSSHSPRLSRASVRLRWLARSDKHPPPKTLLSGPGIWDMGQSSWGWLVPIKLNTNQFESNVKCLERSHFHVESGWEMCKTSDLRHLTQAVSRLEGGHGLQWQSCGAERAAWKNGMRSKAARVGCVFWRVPSKSL